MMSPELQSAFEQAKMAHQRMTDAYNEFWDAIKRINAMLRREEYGFMVAVRNRNVDEDAKRAGVETPGA